MTTRPDSNTVPFFGNGKDKGKDEGEGLAEVLASIRELVSAETAARLDDADTGPRADDDVLVLTPQMRVTDADGPIRSGEILTEGLEDRPGLPQGAPILDEEALRAVVNTIVREELQGELGDRISRNLRKLIRREIGQVMLEQKDRAD